MEKIKLKINKTSELFGYPDFIFNDTQLDKAYDEFDVSEEEFFKNQVSDLAGGALASFNSVLDFPR